MQELELSYTVGRNGKWKNWKMVWQFLKTLNIHLPHNPSIHSEKKGNICPHIDLYNNVHNSFIWKQLKCHQQQMSKQIMVNPYNETLLNNKKEGNVDTSNKKDESQNNYSESKEDRQKRSMYCMIPFT